MLALEGITVLDLSGLAPGAFCTMILGDLGADVIKVEAPMPSIFANAGPSPKGDEKRREAAYFALNRNKRSLALNLKSEAGKQVFYSLARDADVVVEGYRPGVVKELGVDYETISGLNPRIVYCSLSGYGQSGPYRSYPGHDINYISVAGVLGMIGPSKGPPVVPLNLAGDFAGASLHGAIGILAALMARNSTGKGQYVDISYADGALALMTFFTTDYFRDGVVPRRGESTIHGVYPHYGVYETSDGKYLSLGCIELHFWENLCRLLGKDEYIPYSVVHVFAKPHDEKWEEISSTFRQTFLTKTRDEWFDLMKEGNIPVAKVYDLDEVFTDPQVIHRQMLVEVEDPVVGTVRQVGIATKLSDTPGEIRSLSPLLGEHSEEILREAGYGQDEIDRLRQDGAVA